MSQADHTALPPSPWVVRFVPLIPAGASVLDLACGRGRHVRLLLGRGHTVVALDRDAEALAALPRSPALEIITADLENGSPWPLAARRFAAIIVTNYLHRPLFPMLLDALAPSGLLIYETFAVGNERFGRPSNPDFLLKPGELLEVVRGVCAVIAYEHLEVAEPRPAVVQRICARRLGD
ncbi:MAG: class I SAM-dependent methyltransferase [Alphaproteobacteria bacterium]|nr:class I SAM-dependent methyltransferase [Alphaproteobacteria bacterium]